MGRIFIILALFIQLILNGQIPVNDLVNKTWYLKNMSSPFLDPTYNYLVNSEYNSITLNFYLDNGVLKYNTKVCATKTGIVNEISGSGGTMVAFQNNVNTGQSCINPTTNNFEALYFSHIFDEQYLLNIAQNSSGTYTLTLSSPSFCEAIFSSELLSTQEFSESKFLIYPTSVKENLTIQNPNNTKIEIKVTDILGKLLLKQKTNLNSTKIDFSTFPKGSYFISIESNDKIIQSKKIIKN